MEIAKQQPSESRGKLLMNSSASQKLNDSDKSKLQAAVATAEKARNATYSNELQKIQKRINVVESQIINRIQSQPPVRLPEPRESRPEPQSGLNLLELNQMLETVR